MKVVFSDAARADLAAIGDYIAQDNPRRALTFIRELRAVAQRIGDMPARVEADRVAIVHILHGARESDPILFPDG